MDNVLRACVQSSYMHADSYGSWLMAHGSTCCYQDIVKAVLQVQIMSTTRLMKSSLHVM